MTVTWSRVSLLLVAVAVGPCGCRREPTPPGGKNSSNSVVADGACLADAIGELRVWPSIPQCASGKVVCELRCRLGQPEACLGLAYAADASLSPEEVRDLYRRACLLGAANACTNYAAGLWIGKTTNAQVACARRTFEKACHVKEQFACGMVGRVMLESGGTPDYVEGQRYLKTMCDQVGGFSCRVLARHLESGDFGAPQPSAIPPLLKRACDGGDIYACGDHATVAETFN